MKILITGKSGYIARSLHSHLYSKYDVTIVGRQDFDLTNYEATCEFFKDKHFDVIIHAAASGGSRLKQDNDCTLSDNLNMFWNLLANKKHYARFITFGSGAELYDSSAPYGLSKKVIADALLHREDFYNLRVYAVFDENERDTRFIKANILRYLAKEDLNIHSDKFMDFYYMEDLVSLVEYYLAASNPPSVVDCCYSDKYKLSDIAQMITTLDDYKSNILVGTPNLSEKYTGSYTELPIKPIGLQEGIKRTYNILKQSA